MFSFSFAHYRKDGRRTRILFFLTVEQLRPESARWRESPMHLFLRRHDILILCVVEIGGSGIRLRHGLRRHGEPRSLKHRTPFEGRSGRC